MLWYGLIILIGHHTLVQYLPDFLYDPPVTVEMNAVY